MGITGLLPYLEKATRPCHISEFRGGTVVVDSYCWLHNGASVCAEQLARGEDNLQYVYVCLKYVKMLLSYDIHPIMVFDGGNLPAKSLTERKRRESRKKAKQRASELLSLGKTEEARSYLRQCVDVTPKMANNLIKACRELNVDCIVAPYEADAQLAFFSLRGIAEVVITQDSDLVLFGCKQIFYKMDSSGSGYLVESEKIPLAVNMRPDQYSFEKFRHMCILSGCDYLESLPGIGLKKAEKFLTKTVETNPEIFIDRIPRYLNMKNLTIPEGYKENFFIADATFKHQIVFDPIIRKLTHLTDPFKAGTNPNHLKNAGHIYDHEKAYQVAIGNLDPYNFEKFGDWKPPENASPYSIWSQNGPIKKRVSRKLSKELSKESMSKFLSQKKSELKIEIIDEEKIKAEQDSQWKKELAIYDNPVSENIEENNEVPKEEKKSPILHRNNPFLAKRKLSKFSLTETSTNVTVKSRFFTKATENLPDYTEENVKASLEEIEEKMKEDVVLLSQQSSDIESQETTSFEVTEIVDNSENLKNVEVHTAKRPKLGPCRPVGLRRTNSAKAIQPGQKTLKHFFSQFAKK